MTIALHKPYGVLSQYTPDGSPNRTLAELGLPPAVWPVGRLDADSEGLLLLTDDKSLTDKLLNPKRHVSKTYWVQVEGIPDAAALQKLRRGVDIRINGKMHHTLPAQVLLLDREPSLPPRVPPIRVRQTVPDCWLEITITEGKNRQLRRMCAAVGYPVLRLVRAGMGPYRLDKPPLENMSPGEVRPFDRLDF